MRSLPIIEGDQINEKLQEIQNHKGFTHQNWPQFLEYFSRIWLEKYPIKNITLRTNNYLERYNRRLGNKFQNAQPNIFAFIAAIKDEQRYCSNLTNGIGSGNIPYSVEF
ncbi:hypothetical protein HZS_6630 [Henneguya salminicola]|nr:hypothetical protein HZS_6630 [Henneguya salminicola]